MNLVWFEFGKSYLVMTCLLRLHLNSLTIYFSDHSFHAAFRMSKTAKEHALCIPQHTRPLLSISRKMTHNFILRHFVFCELTLAKKLLLPAVRLELRLFIFLISHCRLLRQSCAWPVAKSFTGNAMNFSVPYCLWSIRLWHLTIKRKLPWSAKQKRNGNLVKTTTRSTTVKKSQ